MAAEEEDVELGPVPVVPLDDVALDVGEDIRPHVSIIDFYG